MSDNEVVTQASRIFLGAAAYIRKYGWQVSGMSSHGQPRCSMGALESAGPRGRWNKRVAEVMYDELTNQLHGMSLTSFNEKHRNGELVAQLFEQTAGKLRA